MRFAGRREIEVAADLAGLLRRVRARAGRLHGRRVGPERGQPAPRGRRARDPAGRRGGAGLRRLMTATGPTRPAPSTWVNRARSPGGARDRAAAQQAGVEAVRPGVDCQDIDRAPGRSSPRPATARSSSTAPATASGSPPTSRRTWSRARRSRSCPACASRSSRDLPAGRFGVRIEDIVTVTETGGLRLNNTDRTLRRRVAIPPRPRRSSWRGLSPYGGRLLLG